MSYSEMMLNNEKAMLARYILDIDNVELLTRVKKSLASFIAINSDSEPSKTEHFLNEVAGKWEDNRSAEEMVEDIHNARRSRFADTYINPFEA